MLAVLKYATPSGTSKRCRCEPSSIIQPAPLSHCCPSGRPLSCRCGASTQTPASGRKPASCVRAKHVTGPGGAGIARAAGRSLPLKRGRRSRRQECFSSNKSGALATPPDPHEMVRDSGAQPCSALPIWPRNAETADVACLAAADKLVERGRSPPGLWRSRRPGTEPGQTSPERSAGVALVSIRKVNIVSVEGGEPSMWLGSAMSDAVRARLGAHAIGATIYVAYAGQPIWPYGYHHGSRSGCT